LAHAGSKTYDLNLGKVEGIGSHTSLDIKVDGFGGDHGFKF